jgi:hypothetical protein
MNKEAQTTSTRGLRLIGQGREAEIFEWSDGRALKLLRARGSNAGLAREIAALHAARSAGVPVPQTYGEVTIEGRSGLVMDRFEGADLLTIIGQKPWRVFQSGAPPERSTPGSMRPRRRQAMDTPRWTGRAPDAVTLCVTTRVRELCSVWASLHRARRSR